VWPLATATDEGVLPFPGAKVLPWVRWTSDLDEVSEEAQELPSPEERPEEPPRDVERFYPVEGLRIVETRDGGSQPPQYLADVGSDASYANYLPTGYRLQNEGRKRLEGPAQSQSISGAFFRIANNNSTP
jgi:hypothetical protein